MSSTTAKILPYWTKSSHSNSVEMSFDTDKVIIEKQGPNLIIRPQRYSSWAEYFVDPAMALSDAFELPDDPPSEPVE